MYSVGGGGGTCVVSIAYSKHIYASMYRHGQTLIKMWRGVSHRSDDIATATVAKRGRCVWTRTSCSAFFFSSKSHTPRIETDRYTNTAWKSGSGYPRKMNQEEKTETRQNWVISGIPDTRRGKRRQRSPCKSHTGYARTPNKDERVKGTEKK